MEFRPLGDFPVDLGLGGAIPDYELDKVRSALRKAGLHPGHVQYDQVEAFYGALLREQFLGRRLPMPKLPPFPTGVMGFDSSGSCEPLEAWRKEVCARTTALRKETASAQRRGLEENSYKDVGDAGDAGSSAEPLDPSTSNPGDREHVDHVEKTFEP